jgi:aminoglycoside phosphotransferase (APT) family kinase protein
MPDAEEIRTALESYLGAGLADLWVLASGWETTVFEFALATKSPRATALPVAAPLVLRFYEGSRADEKGRRENLAMRRLADLGYPVPQPYLYEADRTALGAPFLVMERATGGPLFTTRSFPNAFKTFSLGFIGFVRAQTRLHRLGAAKPVTHDLPPAFATEGKPAADSLTERILGIIGRRIEQGPLPGVRDAFEHLRAAASGFKPLAPAIVHMDYHPQNVIVRGLRVTGVIDWVNADYGDRHLCAAMTATILATSTMERPHWMRENVAGNSLRRLFASLYIPLYHALAPMELRRFRYCQALAALYRLSTFGMMRTRGPESVGYRPQAIENVTPSVVSVLSRYVTRKSGVPASIEGNGVPRGHG